ncbi:MAG TPA: mechanosensitive ion channel domain-containing protein [Candidatus Binataceae bacterium]|nr:mechanosensitive ion channel domain-containing protein [Candidatus Binataceae bacterium]
MIPHLGINIPQFIGSRWLVAGAVLTAWIVLLLLVKRILFAVIARAARRPHLHDLSPLIEAISPALAIAIIVGGVKVAAQIALISGKWQAEVDVVLVGGVIAALVVFTDRISQIWLRHQAARYALFTEGYGIVTGAVRGLIVVLGLLMFLESVGISIGPLLASLGIGSLAVALALQETFKNIFSGLFLIADKPLEVGDFVKLQDGQQGALFELGWRSSKFRMLTNEVVVVPNSKLIDSIVTNFRGSGGDISVSVDIAVLNSNDPAHVERVALEVAHEVMTSFNHRNSMPDPEVLFGGMGGNLINLTVVLRIASSDLIAEARNQFMKRLLARFAREEIKLPA